VGGYVFSSVREADRIFYQGAEAFSDGAYNISLVLFNKFITQFPQNEKVKEAKIYIAKCLYFKEKYQEAFEILNSLGEEKEEKLGDEIYYWLAKINLVREEYHQAKVYCRKVIEGFKKSKFCWPAYYIMAKCYLKLGECERGERLLEKIIEESNQIGMVEDAFSTLANSYYERKAYFLLSQLVGRYFNLFPQGKLKARMLFLLGESKCATSNFSEAEENYRKALQWSRDVGLSDLVYQGMGFCYLRQGEEKKAVDYWERIAEEELKVFSFALYYFKTKKYVLCLKTINEFLKRFPYGEYYLRGYLVKGSCLYEMGRINDAISTYSEILPYIHQSRYFQVRDEVYYGLGWCYFKKREFSKAIEMYSKGLKYTHNPTIKMSSQLQIADIYQEMGRWQEAQKLYEKILREDVSNSYQEYIQFQKGMCFLRREYYSQALECFSDLEKNYPFSKFIPQIKYYLALSYFSEKNYPPAIKLLREFVEKYPQHFLSPKAYYLLGKCFYQQGNYHQALQVFNYVIKQFKDEEVQGNVYIDRAYTYLNLSHYSKAIEDLEDFLEDFPNSVHFPLVALHLGRLYEKVNKWEEAKRCYELVMRRYYHGRYRQEAIFSLGNLYRLKGDLEKAEEYFRKLLGDNQDKLSFQTQFYLAEILAQRDKVKEAISIYDKIIALDKPISKLAIVKKAFLLKNLGDYRQAAFLFREVIDKGENSFLVRFSLGICLEKLGRNMLAIEEYFKIIHQFDKLDYKIKAYFRIADIYEREKKHQQAREIYEKIIAFNRKEAKIAKERIRRLEEIRSN